MTSHKLIRIFFVSSRIVLDVFGLFFIVCAFIIIFIVPKSSNSIVSAVSVTGNPSASSTKSIPQNPPAPAAQVYDPPLFQLAAQEGARFLVPCDAGDLICESVQTDFENSYVEALSIYPPAMLHLASLLAPGSDHPGLRTDQIEACAWAVLASAVAPPGFVDNVCLPNTNTELLHAAKARVIHLKQIMRLPLSP